MYKINKICYRPASIFCSGSLVSHEHIVLAAHCFCMAFKCPSPGKVNEFDKKKVLVFLGFGNSDVAQFNGPIKSFAISGDFYIYDNGTYQVRHALK